MMKRAGLGPLGVQESLSLAVSTWGRLAMVRVRMAMPPVPVVLLFVAVKSRIIAILLRVFPTKYRRYERSSS